MSDNEGQTTLRVVGATSPVGSLSTAERAVPMTKPRLLALTNALHRTLASSLGYGLTTGRAPEASALVVAFFQRRAYFSAEQLRFEALGALGVTTLVGFPGDPGELGPSIDHVDLSGRPEVEDAWVLAAFDGTFGSALVAVDDKSLVDAPSLEQARRFVVRWTIDPGEARAALRQLLAPLRPRIARRSLARIEAALGGSEEASEERSSAWVQTLAGELIPSLEIDAAPSGRDEVAERDLLTGLHNRTFLDRYLPDAAESAAHVAVLYVDIDDLGELNEREGSAAGDAALIAVAGALATERRRGDVLVRYGSDEFVMLAPVDGEEAAIALARRLVVAVRAARLEYPFESSTVTISVGVALADPAAIRFDLLTEAVGLAKTLGKNTARLVE